jgi:hypothetical protein
VTIKRFGLLDHEVSLIHGWLPWTVQVIAAVALAAAVGWRSLWWRLVCVPSAGLVGVVAAGVVGWYINSAGMGDAAPLSLSIWIGLTVVAVVVLAVGWRGARWWRRVVCVLALPLCLLCAALAVNQSVGYLPTVQAAWSQATGAPVAGQVDEATVSTMQRAGVVPAHGVVEPVNIGDQASHLAHRTELVYLPPTWFATNPPPKLPTVMMIGGMFSTPADWIRAGDAITALDNFAAAHGGNAPVVVFVDAGGLIQHRYRVRERDRWQRRRPSHERRCAVHDFEIRSQRQPSQLGRCRLVDGWHLRDRSDGYASGHVQRVH